MIENDGIQNSHFNNNITDKNNNTRIKSDLKIMTPPAIEARGSSCGHKSFSYVEGVPVPRLTSIQHRREATIHQRSRPRSSFSHARTGVHHCVDVDCSNNHKSVIKRILHKLSISEAEGEQ